MVPGVKRLAVREEAQGVLVAVHQGNEALALHGIGAFNPHELEESGHQVDRAHLGLDAATSSNLAVGRFDDERHARRGVVDEEAVRVFFVLAQALAVIADEDDDGVVF